MGTDYLPSVTITPQQSPEPTPVITPTPEPPPAAPSPLPMPDLTSKLWDIGLRIRATEAQKDLMLKGIEQLLLGCAMIGAAAGVEASAIATEAKATEKV